VRTVRLTTGQALVRFLAVQHSERDGVRRRLIPRVFGIFGHGNLLGLGEALQDVRSELPFHQPKHEQAMVHAALGYAKANARLATFACTASIGPGATNLVTGAATATVNRLPVLLLPADTFATRLQGPVLQQLEHPVSQDVTVNDCLRPVSRLFDRIARPEQLLTALPAAMRTLVDPAEAGAVTVALHQDVLGFAHDWPVELFDERTWHVVRPPPETAQLDRAVAVLRSAERPLLIAGGGVHYSEATAELAALVGEHGIPACETSAGKGTVTDRSLHLGGVGVNGTGAAAQLAGEADVVVCVGTRLTDFTTASHTLFRHPHVRFVSINVAAADAAKLGAAPVIADAREALHALRASLREAGWSTPDEHRRRAREAIDAWEARVAADLAPRPGEGLTQGQALRALEDEVREGDVVIAAAGSPPGDLLKLWRCPPGSRAHLEFGFSCMGHELPAGLGWRLAQPDRGRVVVVIGDGTYLMAPTELVTAAQERLDVTVVVLVNGGYQSIHGLQRSSTGESFGNEFRMRDDTGLLAGDPVPIDYAANARSLGATAFDADDETSLRRALAEAADVRGPVVIPVRVEPASSLPASGAWWDLGLPEVSARPGCTRRAEEAAAGAVHRRAHL
jgi:3D-(3,5/4)-trihydroxycyclohexane-1,2-dione acylhydrolase (decyclizing)